MVRALLHCCVRHCWCALVWQCCDLRQNIVVYVTSTSRASVSGVGERQAVPLHSRPVAAECAHWRVVVGWWRRTSLRVHSLVHSHAMHGISVWTLLWTVFMHCFRIHVIMFVASMNTYIALLEYIDTCTWGVDVTRDGLHVIHCDDWCWHYLHWFASSGDVYLRFRNFATGVCVFD